MRAKISQAMVLAAGLGTRMRPITERIPKPLVRLAGKPLIDHVLDRLVGAGVNRAIVNVHYLAELIEVALRNRSDPSVVFSDEREYLLDTGGGVVKALHYFGAEPFFIHNSDSVWLEDKGANLEHMMNAWDHSRMDGLMLLAPLSNCLGYEGKGDFILEAGGLLRRRQEHEVAPYAFAGCSIAHESMFRNAPDGAFSLNKVWDRSIASGRLFGVPLEGTWMHIGTPEALAEAERLASCGNSE